MSIVLLLQFDENYTISSSWLIMSGNMLIQLYELVLEVIISKTLRGQMQPPFGDNYDYIDRV